MSWQPFHILGAERESRFLVTCDHASNHVPQAVRGGSLGLSADDMRRHIAWDPGAAGVTGYLADALQAPAILSDFSRLVIDPNRGTDDPTLVMQVYDGTVIPGNRGIDAAEIAARRALCYDPYHRALADLAGARADRGLVAIHSFTPQMRGGAPRPWEIGILHGKDARLALPLLDLLRAEGDLCVGENEPYGGHLDGDSIDKHALAAGRPNVLIELRNDVIRTAGQQAAWAARLAPMIRRVLDQSGL